MRMLDKKKKKFSLRQTTACVDFTYEEIEISFLIEIFIREKLSTNFRLSHGKKFRIDADVIYSKFYFRF